MSLLQDCSELREAVRLSGGLMKPKTVPPEGSVTHAERDLTEQLWATAEMLDMEESRPYQEDENHNLESVLASMCRRGGLSGAIVADANGLPLANFNYPVSKGIVELITILGDSLVRAAKVAESKGAELISLDVNYSDKLVLRRFPVKSEQYVLLLTCPQKTDERSEVESQSSS